MGKKLLLVPLLTLLIAFAVGIGSLQGPMFDSAQAEGERGTLYIDVVPDASNTISGYGTIDVCRDDLAVGDTFDIDIVVAGADDLAGPSWMLYYSKDILKVTAYDWVSWKMAPGRIDVSDPLPDSDGEFFTTYAGPTGVNGDGVLQRVTFQAIATGSSDLTLCTVTGDCPDMADSDGDDHFYPQVLVDDPADTLRVTVGQSCSEAPQPSPLATGAPTIPAVTATPARTATPALTATPARTTTPPATASSEPTDEQTGNGFPWLAVCAGVGAGVVVLVALGLLVRLLRQR